MDNEIIKKMNNKVEGEKASIINEINFKNFVANIVKDSCELKNKHTAEIDAKVNYACIFSQNDKEFIEFKKLAGRIGRIIEETPTGPLFQIKPLDTISGLLRLLKIRNSDKTRPERGDADFTVNDYHAFKNKYLLQDNFKLISRDKFEMIELIDPDFNVRAYFSHPTLEEQIGISN